MTRPLDLDALKREIAGDLSAARARLELIDDMSLLLTAMRSRGFRPQLDLGQGPRDLRISITVDLNDLRMPGAEVAPAQDATPEPETPPKPEAQPDPKRAWTEAEEGIALQLDEQGFNTREIGEQLHRSWQAVALRLKALKAEGSEPAAKPEADPEPEPEPVDPEPEPAPDLEALPVRERAIERRLQAAGYPAPFTPQTDLAVAQALFRGDGLGCAAEKLSIDKADLLARYKTLMPEPSVEDQPALLAVLRRRLERAS
jgi:hypothetical protein